MCSKSWEPAPLSLSPHCGPGLPLKNLLLPLDWEDYLWGIIPPSSQVPDSVNKTIFPFPPSLVSWVLIFEEWTAEPELGTSCLPCNSWGSWLDNRFFLPFSLCLFFLHSLIPRNCFQRKIVRAPTRVRLLVFTQVLLETLPHAHLGSYVVPGITKPNFFPFPYIVIFQLLLFLSELPPLPVHEVFIRILWQIFLIWNSRSVCSYKEVSRVIYAD